MYDPYWNLDGISDPVVIAPAYGLKDVALEVWDRVSLSADAAWARVEAGWATAQAGIYDGLQDATAAVVGWANSTVNTFEGTFLAVQAIWGALPDVFDRVGALAINGLVEVMQTGIAGITEAMMRTAEQQAIPRRQACCQTQLRDQ